jgi:hypothetical protein
MTKDNESHLETLTAQSAQMRAEAKETALTQQQAELQREFQSAVERERSIQEQEKRVTDIIPPGITRDQLLERIREMRNVKVEVAHDYYISPEQQAQLDLEQATGRAAVAKAEAEAKKISDARMLAVAVENARQADMTPVHHPNPSQDEQYPAIKSTLGKPSTPPSAPKQLK